ncbi:MAG: tryptophan 7-halogenase [Planctomycetaceae bacterium]|nr:tryptophan 7-halogenase [Planctomycetaceae bacterium]
MKLKADVVILGSGCGGSLLSLLLSKSGMTVATVDSNIHPRFVIGESSTPLADQMLARWAERFDIPELLSLATYGNWQRAHPEVICGLKRGFSYFGHVRERHAGSDDDTHAEVTMAVQALETQQMLVAASSADFHADTHWLRSDVDHLLFQLAARHGVIHFQGAKSVIAESAAGWQVAGTADGRRLCIEAPFIVDATGGAGVLLKHLRIPDQTESLKTNSRAVFAHFRDVLRVEELLDRHRISKTQHPFCCDNAAVHHVLDDGWMWQLRFRDKTLSAGFLLAANTPGSRDSSKLSASAAGVRPEDLWQRQLDRNPLLAEQFAAAKVVRPVAGLQQTKRLQRLTTQAAGRNWAVLPNTAGFIDPLHSTGIAHTLSGVDRLTAILIGSRDPASIDADALQRYSRDVTAELRYVDELIEGCYAGLPSFRLWCLWSMIYFAAATSTEQTANENSAGFLRCGDEGFRDMIRTARRQLPQCNRPDGRNEAAVYEAATRFEDTLRQLLQPWNHVGLLNPAAQGMYATTAAPAV